MAQPKTFRHAFNYCHFTGFDIRALFLPRFPMNDFISQDMQLIHLPAIEAARNRDDEQAAYDSLVTTLELYGPISIAKLVAIEEHHGHSRDHVFDGINWLILEGMANVVNGSVEPVSYRKKENKKPSLLRRLAEKLVPFISVFVLSVSIYSSEMPSWVLPGILKIETNSYYGQNGIIYVDKRRGEAGEVGPFQALPATLRDFRLSPSLVEQDAKYAEAATVLILSHYYKVTGSWAESVAAWNRGLGGRHSRTAVNYAKNALSIGSQN